MHFFVFTLLAIAAVSPVQVESEEKCEPGEFLMEFCNKCVCGPDGKTKSCTRMSCPLGVYNKNGSLKNPNGSLVGPLLRERREIDKSIEGAEKKNCEPFSHFKVDCNHCWCAESGTLAMCSVEHCDDTTCEPGKVVRKGCDECICNRTGNQSTCITKFCHDGLEPRSQAQKGYSL